MKPFVPEAVKFALPATLPPKVIVPLPEFMDIKQGMTYIAVLSSGMIPTFFEVVG